MRRQTTKQRLIHAALIALAAGGLVAGDNPAPRLSREGAVAIASLGSLAAQSADAMTRTWRG